jgi:hypothetical protein
MPEGTWTCSNCGQIYSLAEPTCTICRITRENRDVVGRITTIRSPKPPPEQVEVGFPITFKDARFNLPLDTGAVWASGKVMVIAAGFFLLSEKDPADAAALAANPPAAAGPVGAMSLYVPRAVISRIIHQKLIGEFIEIGGKQKIPLRLSPAGWADLDVLCDQLGIPRS